MSGFWNWHRVFSRAELARLGTNNGRRRTDPALAWLRKLGVLDQQEAERADIEGYGFVIIPNDNRDESEVLRHGSLC